MRRFHWFSIILEFMANVLYNRIDACVITLFYAFKSSLTLNTFTNFFLNKMAILLKFRLPYIFS